MYDLRVEGVSLDVFAGSSITLNGVNPALDKDRILREYTFPLRVPRSEQNEAAFSYQGRLDASKSERKYKAQLYIAGIQYSTGIVRLKNADRNSYNIEYKSANLDKWKELEDVDLAQNQPIDKVPPVTSSGFVQVHVVQPVGQQQYLYATVILDDVEVTGIYDYHQTSAFDIADQFADLINTKYGSPIAFSNFQSAIIDIDVVTIQKFAAFDNLWVDRDETFSELKHEDFKSYIKGKTTDTSVIGDITFPIMLTQNEKALSNIANNWRSDEGWKWNSLSEDKERFYGSFIPAMRVREVLLRSLNNYDISGIEIEGVSSQDQILDQLYLYSNRTLDRIISEKISEDDPNVDPQWFYFNTGKHTIDYNQHVPQTGVQDLLFAIAEMLNAYIVIRGETLIFKALKNVYLSEPRDWTDFTDEKYDITFVEEDGLKVDYTRYTQEQKEMGGFPNSYVYNDQLLPRIYGEGENDLELSWATSYQSGFIDVSYEPSWTIKDEVGPEETIDDIVFGWIAPQPLTDPNTPNSFSVIPMVANRNWADENDPPYNVFPFSLDLSDDNYSFWDVFYQGWESSFTGDEVKIRINLAIHDIIDILKWKEPLRWMHDEQGQFLGIIKKFKLKVTDENIMPATVTLIKLQSRPSIPA